MAKITVWKGDITTLATDAIVNAANGSLLGGGGVDGAIHTRAGPQLYQECKTLNGCETGQAKATKGYNLPARHVIHTVGPIIDGKVGKKQEEMLASCYTNCLDLCKSLGLQSVAFPCISTGAFGFPSEAAAHTAIAAVTSWIKENHHTLEEVIFCVFLEKDLQIYSRIVEQ
jgi:O-acetyl-ADP-ribose deacetylase (regulator of RNase III)